MIELIVNGRSLDLSDRTQIGLTILSSDITSLITRTGDFTNSFVVPATKHNMEVLEFVNLPTSSTDLPYRIVRCSYIQDGIEIVSDAYTVVSSVTIDNITLNIFSGNLDFIKAIGDLTVADLYFNEPVFNIDMDLVINGNKSVVFPLIKWNEISDYYQTTSTIDPRQMLPCLKFTDILDKLSDKLGYTINGNFDENIIVTPNQLEMETQTFEITDVGINIPRVNSVNVAEGSATTNLIFSPVFNTPQTPPFAGNRFAPVTDTVGVLRFETDVLWRWYADGSYGLFEFPKTRNVYLRTSIKDNLGNVLKTITSSIVEYQMGNTSFSGNIGGALPWSSSSAFTVLIESPSFTFVGGREYFIEYDFVISQHDNIPTIFETQEHEYANCRMTFNTDPNLLYGNTSSVSNLFKMKVVDVIKEVINSYQVMISTDNYIKNVQFNYLDLLLDNKENAINWSDKLIDVEGVGFVVPKLAKINNLKYKENDNTPNDSDSFFEVENENIQEETTLIQLKSEMTRTFDGFNSETVCLIDGLDDNYKFLNPSWRILELETKNTAHNIVYNDGSTVVNRNTNTPFAVFRNFDYLKTNYFNVLQDLSANAKVINGFAKLTSLDILEIKKTLTPVWIYSAKFNIDGYFHVNKIENYKNNIAKVELIRI